MAKRAVGRVQSVDRALDTLEMLAAGGGTATISAIAAGTGLPLATAHRLVSTLVARGYLRQLPDRRYGLGPGLVTLGASAQSRLGDLARPLLVRLADVVRESVNLAMLSGDNAEYVAQAPGRHAMRMFTEVGRRVPLHCTGVGKAILSLMSDEQVMRVARTGLAEHTSHTITTAVGLVADLRLIRRRGYAIDDEEMEIGVRCVAVALQGRVPLALSVSGPCTRMPDEQLPVLAGLLVRAGAEVLRVLDR